MTVLILIHGANTYIENNNGFELRYNHHRCGHPRPCRKNKKPNRDKTDSMTESMSDVVQRRTFAKIVLTLSVVSLQWALPAGAWIAYFYMRPLTYNGLSLGILAWYYFVVVLPIAIVMENLGILLLTKRAERILFFLFIGLIIIFYWRHAMPIYPCRALFIMGVSITVAGAGGYGIERLWRRTE